jgi:hypothetical protein
MVVPGGLADFVAPGWSFLPFYLSQFAFTLLIPPRGPLLEEGGWRGFALPSGLTSRSIHSLPFHSAICGS